MNNQYMDNNLNFNNNQNYFPTNLQNNMENNKVKDYSISKNPNDNLENQLKLARQNFPRIFYKDQYNINTDGNKNSILNRVLEKISEEDEYTDDECYNKKKTRKKFKFF